MKAIKIFFFVFIIIVTKIFAQVEFDYSGYIVNMPVYNFKSFDTLPFTNNSKYTLKNFVDITRFRFRPVVYLWEGARVNLEYESNFIYNDVSDFMFNYGSSVNNSKQLVDLNWEITKSGNLRINHFIDRFYFKQDFEFGNIILGRQRIAWGTGRIWNPLDLFNPINPANFTKIEKDGADAITSKIIFGDFTDLQLVFNPDKLIRKSNYAFRFRTNFNEYDLSLVGGVIDNRTIMGFDFAGNLSKAGLRGEFLYSENKTNSSDNFIKYILGIDYQLTQKLYALLEYHFNGEGKQNKPEYQLIKLTQGEILNLGKNYLAANVTFELTPLFKLSFLSNFNLNDSSGFITLSGNYSLDDDIYLDLGSQISYGEELSEYYFYPNSFYTKIEIYF